MYLKHKNKTLSIIVGYHSVLLTRKPLASYNIDTKSNFFY
nr:MAG TPA: hypothetical protein [Caudoviricetes sp.]